MNQEAITIRKISDRDESRWRELFDAYNRFYGREPSEPLTQHTWRRIMDPTSSVHAIVAVDTANHVAGFANYIIHESTTRLTPLCYLQDLLVDQSQRGGGVGKRLIDWLILEMKAERWSLLYWHTKETNYRARGLYDKYTPHSGFLRYAVNNDV
jgi:GNAT superfamily N-acetyltransferase